MAVLSRRDVMNLLIAFTAMCLTPVPRGVSVIDATSMFATTGSLPTDVEAAHTASEETPNPAPVGAQHWAD